MKSFFNALQEALSQATLSNASQPFEYNGINFIAEVSPFNTKVWLNSPYFLDTKGAHIWVSSITPTDIEFNHNGNVSRNCETYAEKAKAVAEKAQALILFSELLQYFSDTEGSDRIFEKEMVRLQTLAREKVKSDREMNKAKVEEKRLELIEKGYKKATREDATRTVKAAIKQAKDAKGIVTLTILNITCDGKESTTTIDINGEGKRIKFEYREPNGYIEPIKATSGVVNMVKDSYFKA
ncbi:hypothetical protein QTV49_000481 [Vibrio vulnificus]|nr:hypothetical protein [Vibrio vulnificus]